MTTDAITTEALPDVRRTFGLLAKDKEAIVTVIRELPTGNLDALPPITQLTEIRVETNGAIQVVDR